MHDKLNLRNIEVFDKDVWKNKSGASNDEMERSTTSNKVQRTICSEKVASMLTLDEVDN